MSLDDCKKKNVLGQCHAHRGAWGVWEEGNPLTGVIAGCKRSAAVTSLNGLLRNSPRATGERQRYGALQDRGFSCLVWWNEHESGRNALG